MIHVVNQHALYFTRADIWTTCNIVFEGGSWGWALNLTSKNFYMLFLKKKGGGLFPSLFNFIYMYVEIISDVEKSGVGWGEGVVMIFAWSLHGAALILHIARNWISLYLRIAAECWIVYRLIFPLTDTDNWYSFGILILGYQNFIGFEYWRHIYYICCLVTCYLFI